MVYNSVVRVAALCDVSAWQCPTLFVAVLRLTVLAVY